MLCVAACDDDELVLFSVVVAYTVFRSFGFRRYPHSLSSADREHVLLLIIRIARTNKNGTDKHQIHSNPELMIRFWVNFGAANPVVVSTSKY